MEPFLEGSRGVKFMNSVQQPFLFSFDEPFLFQNSLTSYTSLSPISGVPPPVRKIFASQIGSQVSE